MNIYEAIARHPDLIGTFFEHSGTTLIVLIDENYIVFDCNESLIRTLYVPNKPVGRFLGDFVCSMEDQEFSLIVSKQHQKPLPQILRICYTEILYRFYTFACRNGYLLLGDRLGSTDNEVLESISLLNNELSSMSREISQKNRKLEDAYAQISELVRTDHLTKLANRRYFQERYAELYSLARRQAMSLSVVMFDIDYFKSVNDTYGHAAGDKVLETIGERLLNGCREEDIAARFGGEEFIVCLPHIGAGQALAFGERIREDLSAQDILGNGHKITLSTGIAELKAEDSQEALINRADRALYQAKEAGRDRAVVDETA